MFCFDFCLFSLLQMYLSYNLGLFRPVLPKMCYAYLKGYGKNLVGVHAAQAFGATIS